MATINERIKDAVMRKRLLQDQMELVDAELAALRDDLRREIAAQAALNVPEDFQRCDGPACSRCIP